MQSHYARHYVLSVRILFFILFLYSGFVKLADYRLFQEQMLQSPLLPPELIEIISFTVPLSEIILATALMFPRYAGISLYLSTLLMFAFSIYLIGLVTCFENIPCSCGGILSNLSYGVHIIFNVVCTLCGVCAIYIMAHAQKTETPALSVFPKPKSIYETKNHFDA